ncbi:hypothetical protein L484_022396 [Morus notabilis]|uniref:Uncharacterized protein n=1 Tax=Morus notabilis TaxID=981085 RepID=W9QTC2_9ROSA|nr:hypothetical protein L484_022396 [Morus notabilis]
MKLIWVLLENRGQNGNFSPNRVKPRVHRSTGDRAVQQHRSTGGVQSIRLDRSTGQSNAIRSTALVDRLPCDPVNQTGRPVESAAGEKLAKTSLKTCKSSPKSKYFK